MRLSQVSSQARRTHRQQEDAAKTACCQPVVPQCPHGSAPRVMHRWRMRHAACFHLFLFSEPLGSLVRAQALSRYARTHGTTSVGRPPRAAAFPVSWSVAFLSETTPRAHSRPPLGPSTERASRQRQRQAPAQGSGAS
ncbi:hypothetical protein TRVL_07477 [Trypanosoma vivax]|nr:hypothetical protein TRVL_07477 [Trypanosoma vivax]